MYEKLNSSKEGNYIYITYKNNEILSNKCKQDVTCILLNLFLKVNEGN